MSHQEGMSRRSFLKGMAWSAAGLGLATILPGGIITAAESAGSEQEGKQGDGIYIRGVAENMQAKDYTLEFVQPVQFVAILNGKEQTDGIWRTSNKHLVSVSTDGVVTMRDGVGGYNVTVAWSLGDTTFYTFLHTGQTAGAHSIDVDSPMTRGAFMVRLARYFGWHHYNAYMDDGTDIDDDGNIAKAERVRTYYDVNGDSETVKAIEAALDMGVLVNPDAENRFYPMSQMTREDAAKILCDAFHLAPLETDFIGGFDDAKEITDEAAKTALNTLVGRGFMKGRTNFTLNPTDGITDTEARHIIEAIDACVVAPVWAQPVSHRKFVRCRPEWFTSTQDAVVHWRYRNFNVSDDRLYGQEIGDRGVGIIIQKDWSEWEDYIPGLTRDHCFGLNNCYYYPYDHVYFGVEVEVYATKEGLEDSPHTFFKWMIDRQPWHTFATDKLHEAGADYPMVYRFFDNFQAAAYYIEGSDMGILYDGLMETKTDITLIDRVKEVATPGKKIIFVLGHNHIDHYGAMPRAFEAGWEIYLCDRVGPMFPHPGGMGIHPEWTIEEYDKNYDQDHSDDKYVTKREGTYAGSDLVHIIKEGYEFDLGNCKFKVYQLPGHMDDMMILYDAKTGLMFSSDIYAVNRYWVADNFGASGVKQDLLLSLQQQLMDQYTKDGAVVRELYTGHNRVGVGGDYLTMWEKCLQKLANFGPFALTHNRRTTGGLMAQDGDEYETMVWTAFTETGTQVKAEYQGKYDGKPFYRMEVDLTADAPSDANSNLYYDYKTNAHLSDVFFSDAELVGHDFKWRTGFDNAEATCEDGRLMFVVENKFFPDDMDYEVKVPAGQTSVTLTPTTMSECCTALTVNDKPVASRCPVKVSTASPAVIKVTGPDGTTTCTYTFTFVNA